MTDLAHEQEPTDEPTTTGAAPARPRRGRLVLVVLVLALLAVSGLAVWQTLRLADAEDDADRRADAARTASDFTVALLSYDFEDLDAQSAAIADLATEDFADEFEEAMGGGLGASIEELQATATAEVTDVMVGEVPGDRARAVVVADSEISSQAGDRASTDTYLDVSMVFLDGRWQVDDVKTIATDAPPQGTGDGEGEGQAGGDGGTAEPAG